MYIDGNPLLHIVDEGTRFQAGRWLRNLTAKHTWDTLRACWIDTYLGPPDLITHNAGKNFVSTEFEQFAINVGSTTNAVPVEAHNSIGIVERYHGPLRRIYNIITAEIPGIDRHMALQMSFKALNDSVGPDGLVPTLLVSGAYPRMVKLDAPSPTITQRAKALEKAMKELEEIRAERKFIDALKARNGPSSLAIHRLTLNSPVLVWRGGNTGQSGEWKGPYNLLAVSGETCTISLPHGPTKFRTTVVKPFLVNSNQDSEKDQSKLNKISPVRIAPTQNLGKELTPQISHSIENENTSHETGPEIPQNNEYQDQPLRRGRPRKCRASVNKCTADITFLLNTNIDPDQFKNSRKNKAFEKSRLVVQAYNYKEKDLVLTQSSTIQRVSQRLILCIAAITFTNSNGPNLYLRDITQAYVQSSTNLNRNFYIRAPSELTDELGIPRNSILKVIKPLYGVPEAGNHWFKTYHDYHMNQLKLNESTYDPCLLWTNIDDYFSIVGLQTDDTLFLVNESFADAEQNSLKKAQFLAKDHGVITLTQERQCNNISIVESDKRLSITSSRGILRKELSTKEQYVAQRARGAYTASMCQLEASFDLSSAAQATFPEKDDIDALNNCLQWQIINTSKGLKFVKLHIKKLGLFVFTDASFANNKDYSSQVGYVLVLADNSKKANIIHWSSIKCKRVTRSVLASELYAMAHGFDIGTAIKPTIEQLLQTKIPLIMCTDSKSLYDCLVKLGTTQEKRLMIDLMCLRQAYERREIAEVKWIEGNSNPADAMTKSKASPALRYLIETNELRIQAKQWVERTNTNDKKLNN
ncbi:hypothetical protein K3495_g4184 [Podosphaera aphanis]|nr:hypothetical protein K3495_g4184 [Podosphaera aphanis]